MTSGDSMGFVDAGQPRGYCCRVAIWDWREPGCANIVERDGGVVHELDAWETMLFFHADCGSTLTDLLERLAAEAGAGATPRMELEERLSRSVRRLLDELGVVELCEKRRAMPYYVEIPRSEWDEVAANRAMREDGLLP